MKADSDYLLFTDGSGYQDGYGGWACIVTDPSGTPLMFRMGCIMGATVDRMELTAILEGLQLVEELKTTNPKSIGDQGRTWHPVVHLFSDRENLVLSIQKVYDRSNAPDLWKRYEFYEGRLHVVARHVERETDHSQFITVDLHASTARIIIKQYGEANELPRHTPIQ